MQVEFIKVYKVFSSFKARFYTDFFLILHDLFFSEFSAKITAAAAACCWIILLELSKAE